MPAIERTIKLPPSMMMQSWMGTDFTNDDLVRESSTLNDYNQKLIGDSVILERKCWKIQLDPLPDAPVVWGKIIAFVDQTDYIQLRAEMYDEDGFLINTMNSSDIRQMDGKKLAAKMEMIPEEKPGNKTVMKITSIEFDKPMEDSFLHVQHEENQVVMNLKLHGGTFGGIDAEPSSRWVRSSSQWFFPL